MDPQNAGHLHSHLIDVPDEAAAIGSQLPAAAGVLLRPLELPHEATHRRYEPPFVVGINQAAIGYTLLVSSRGLHYVKVLAGVLTLDTVGSFMFVHGGGASTDPGVGSPPMGPMPLGQNSGFVLPPAEPENPWLYTASDAALGIVTTGGKAFGWLMCCYSPYDS